MKPRLLIVCLVANGALVQFAAADGEVKFSEKERRLIQRHAQLGPVPKDTTNTVADSEAAARLGQFLFFDERLSANRSVSCATCHDPGKGLADAKPLSDGLKRGTRHAPSLWNVAYNRWFFWDGRADSLWAQAVHPIESEEELGSTRLSMAHHVYSDPPLRTAYASLFGAMPDLKDKRRFPVSARPVPNKPNHPHHVAWSGMTPADRNTANRVFTNLAKSIAAYERKLVSRRSAFDIFAEGLRESNAEKIASLSHAAQRGLKLFLGRGNCRLCHSGPNFTDGEFHNTRVAPLHGGPPRDAGRFVGADLVVKDPFNAAGAFSDDRSSKARVKIEFLANVPDNWGRFKTPTLRNVARSAPYMHQGQFDSLKRVITYYSTLEGALPPGHHQESILVPLNLTATEVDDLVAFLEALTDEGLPPELLRQPKSPGLIKK